MESYRIDEPFRLSIIKALREKKLRQKELAEMIGISNSLMSKVLLGKIKSMGQDHLMALEDALGIRAMEHVTGENRSPLAMRIAARIDKDPAVANLAAALDAVLSGTMIPAAVPYVPSSEMTRIGQEIIRLVFADEDKPGKVARKVIELLQAEIDRRV